MSNYWLHRISYEPSVSRPLLFPFFLNKENSESFLSIGWRELAKKYPNIRENDENYKSYMREIYPYHKKVHESLRNFLCFKKNDLVVVPTWEKDFVVCEILEDHTYVLSEMEQSIISSCNINENVDLGFFKKVKVLNDKQCFIPRKFADNDLTARMKIRQTNANIYDIRASVDEAIKKFKDNKPFSLYDDLSEKFINKSLEIVHKEVTPLRLEELVKSYFKHIGANEIVKPTTNVEDKIGDADILATFDKLKLVICVQVKHHKEYTDSWAVEQIRDYYEGLKEEGMDDGYSKMLWVISTCDAFTQSAIDEAAKSKVQLINGKEFIKMLLTAGLDAFDI